MLLLLADAESVVKTLDFAQKQLDYAADVSFAAYCLVGLFIAVMVILATHFFWIAHPNAKTQRECNEKIATAVQQFAVVDAAKTQILDDLKDLTIANSNKLSAITQSQVETRCPMLSQSRPALQPTHGGV